MPGEPVSRETTLAILLGGSVWPKSPQLAASAAFARSAQDFKHYLTDDRGFNLPATNILDLFDSPKTAPEIVEDVQNYLKQRLQIHPAPRDLFIYYTGHGGFINGRDYFLAVRSTIEGLEGTSSIRVCDLASALRNSARDLRRFLILDCCFAAAAFKEFQTTPGTAARLQTLDAFPRRGTTLLCSSSSRNVSIAPEGERNTMFSGALLDVLRNGDAAIESALSLEDVGLKITELIRDRYDDRAVRPEVHSPDQREEDIARMPLFPNPANRAGGGWRPSHPPQVETARLPLTEKMEPNGARRRRLIPLALAVLPLAAIFGVVAIMLLRPKPSLVDPQAPVRPVTTSTVPANTARQENPPPAPVGPPAGPGTSARGASRGVPVVVKPGSEGKPPAEPADTRTSPAVTPRAVPRAGEAASVNMNGQLLRLVSVPGGEFRMGCSSGDTECDDDEKPVKRVTVDAFQMSATEVTQELWQALMGKNPSDFKGAGRPVEHVSWQDAQDFVETLNQRNDGFSYRLPTEAEWEYAARAPSPFSICSSTWSAASRSQPSPTWTGTWRFPRW